MAASGGTRGVWAVVVISPGPDFVVTVSRAARSRRAGLAAAAGIAAGTAVWASGSAVGLAAVFAHYRWVAEAVRWLGAGYLCWLGIRMIAHARRPLPEVAADGARRGTGSAWRAGILADLGNPKAAVFWSSLFAAMLPLDTPVWTRVTAIALVVAIAAAWYSFTACVFSLAAVAGAYRRAQSWIDRLTGGVLIALAARVATER
ncbi:MAG: LysE family translocator [Micromonosporaceae bacterium]